MIRQDVELNYLNAVKEQLRELRTAKYKKQTLKLVEISTKQFLTHLKESSNTLLSAQDIGKAEILGFVDSRINWKKSNGKPMSPTVAKQRLGCLRKFLRYLHVCDVLPKDLSVFIPRERMAQRLPRQVLTVEEIGRLLLLPKNRPYGKRDIAILETLYGTGMRKAELINLDVSDINFDEKIILIRQGKGSRDRMVPMGEHLENVLDHYLKKVRSLSMVRSDEEKPLFLSSSSGQRLSPGTLGIMISSYMKLGNLKGSSHTLRHCFATHLLKNGANIFYIQRLLGHKNIETTEIYTRVYPKNLLDGIFRYHPRVREALPELVMPIRRSNIRIPYLLKLKAQGKALDPNIYTSSKLSKSSRVGL